METGTFQSMFDRLMMLLLFNVPVRALISRDSWAEWLVNEFYNDTMNKAPNNKDDLNSHGTLHSGVFCSL